VPLASVAVPGPQNLVEEKDVYAYRQYITICSSSCHCIMRDSMGQKNSVPKGELWLRRIGGKLYDGGLKFGVG